MSSRRSPYLCSSKVHSSQSGYTLVELITVVVLITLVSAFFISKFSFTTSWSRDGSIRELANTIQFLIQDSRARQTKYVLEYSKTSNSYTVLEELPPDPSVAGKVDLLQNFRSEKENERRKDKAAKEALSNLGKEYDRQKQIDRGPLDQLFYNYLFVNPKTDGRLVPPLDSPSLSQQKQVSTDLQLQKVTFVDKDLIQNNDNFTIPFSPSPFFPPLSIVFQYDKGFIEIIAGGTERSVRLRYY